MRPLFSFFFNDTATTEICTLPLPDALPISRGARGTGAHGFEQRRRAVPVAPRSALGPDGLPVVAAVRSEEHTSELQSLAYLVCRLLLEKKTATRRGETASPASSRRRPSPLR